MDWIDVDILKPSLGEESVNMRYAQWVCLALSLSVLGCSESDTDDQNMASGGSAGGPSMGSGGSSMNSGGESGGEHRRGGHVGGGSMQGGQSGGGAVMRAGTSAGSSTQGPASDLGGVNADVMVGGQLGGAPLGGLVGSGGEPGTITGGRAVWLVHPSLVAPLMSRPRLGLTMLN